MDLVNNTIDALLYSKKEMYLGNIGEDKLFYQFTQKHKNT